MQNEDFQHWLSQAKELTKYQKQKVSDELSAEAGHIMTVEQLSKVSQCPHCASSVLSRWGQSNGLSRYRCKSCLKTFNALTGTPLARLRHKGLWLEYADMMLESVSIRKAASRVGIDKNTSFRWRHRFLMCPTIHKPEHLTGIVEADETFFLESHKGERGRA